MEEKKEVAPTQAPSLQEKAKALINKNLKYVKTLPKQYLIIGGFLLLMLLLTGGFVLNKNLTKSAPSPTPEAQTNSSPTPSETPSPTPVPTPYQASATASPTLTPSPAGSARVVLEYHESCHHSLLENPNAGVRIIYPNGTSKDTFGSNWDSGPLPPGTYDINAFNLNGWFTRQKTCSNGCVGWPSGEPDKNTCSTRATLKAGDDVQIDCYYDHGEMCYKYVD